MTSSYLIHVKTVVLIKSKPKLLAGYNRCTLHILSLDTRIFLAARSLWTNDLLAR